MPSPKSDWPKAVVFDLDGTLVDSAADIQDAINAGFAIVGAGPFDLAQVRTMIGGGGPAAIARASILAQRSLTASEETRVLARFYEVYADRAARGVGLFPGVHDMLEALRSGGMRLAICTNKAQPITDIAVAALGIGHYFDAVVGAREGSAKKPDPQPVRMALAGLDASPGDAVMVGDSEADIGAARAAGLPSIAVAHGYAKVAVAELGSDFVVTGLEGVIAAIEALRRSRQEIA